MKIAVASSSEKGLEADVDTRFGRAPFFTVVNPESMEVEIVKNSAKTASGGAGVSAAQTIGEEGVQAVLAGNFGPRAFRALKAADMMVYSVSGGTVREVITSFKKGELEELDGHTSSSHSGLNR